MSQYFINLTNEIAVITLTRIPNDIYYISKIFTKIADRNINVDIITKTSVYKDEINIIFTIPEDDITLLLEATESLREFIPFMLTEITSGFSKISLTGIYSVNKADILSDFFKTANIYNINILTVSTSENEISVLIESDNASKFKDTIKEIYKK